MAPKLKQDYPALIAECNARLATGERIEAIKADFESRGINWGTFDNQRRAAKKKAAKERAMSVDESPVEVLPGQLSIEAADTPAEVYYDAVNEFDALPAGYAKVIQPMREYTEAEDEALKESVRLFGFIGAIVRDQYGRILDGNQRSRVAHWFGKGCPFTITEVRDDAHAMEIATQLNLARRHFTPEQRQQIAASLREQGRSYRYIAEALHVSHTQARADLLQAEAKVETYFTPEQPITNTLDPTETYASVETDKVETYFTPETVKTEPGVQDFTPPRVPGKRIQGKDGKIYPHRQPKRSNGTKPTTSTADRQLAGVINLLMKHAHQWDETHWQAFLDVVQSLRGTQAATPATE